MADENKSVKVLFDQGETGWGELIDPCRVRINNIP
jgi:hypothetical protein